MNNDKLMNPHTLVERRRQSLLERIHVAREQLNSSCSFESDYKNCRESLRQWRQKMLEELNLIHQDSVNELNETYEQLDRVRTTTFNLSHEDQRSIEKFDVESNLKTLQDSQFNFRFDHDYSLDVNIDLLKISNGPAFSSTRFNKSTVICRLLISREQYLSNMSFYDPVINRIDHQVPECILICPFDLLNELIAKENEIRLLIDQSYIPTIRSQMQRIIIDYDLVHGQVAQETCPQSTEHVVKLVSHDSTKLFNCIEYIYTICTQQDKPSNVSEYNLLNYNRARIHLYGGFSDIPTMTHISSSINNDKDNVHPRLGTQLQMNDLNKIQHDSLMLTSPYSSHNHFDRVLMPVSIRQTMRITDTQAGALLGPKGERIQQLQRETGAIVTIGESNEHHDRRKRIVYIQGSEQQVNKAQTAIQKVLTIHGHHLEDDTDKSKKVFH